VARFRSPKFAIANFTYPKLLYAICIGTPETKILKENIFMKGVKKMEENKGSAKKLIEGVEKGGFIYSRRQVRIYL